MTAPAPTVVLQVLPALNAGGVERGTIEITEAVARAEGVALVASAGGRLERAVARAGGRHIRLPLDRKNPFAIWRNAARLAALIRAEQVAIVHARSRAPAWSAWLACRRTGAHFVTTYHGTYSEDLPGKRWYNSVMARGEVVIAASHFIADLITRQHRLDPARIRVIPRGVDPAIFDPAAVRGERVAALARAWRLPDGVHTVALPGRLAGWKGQAVLLEALAKLDRADVVGLLIGAGPDGRAQKRLSRKAEALGLAGRVRIVGHVEDMPAALMLSDVVVHASTKPEAFGRVVIEAQAMGRPVIAADLGGPVETVAHGETGWRVPPGDADALAEAIAQALALDEADRAALGARARAAVLAGFTTRAMQEATLDVYEAVLHAPHRSADGAPLAVAGA
ncbi:MAG: glycosyltransferase family 4 protein [Rhodospirillales bacterium]|nr:glycosyltransferase family 4 protein [Rhodospirillales bacterium]